MVCAIMDSMNCKCPLNDLGGSAKLLALSQGTERFGTSVSRALRVGADNVVIVFILALEGGEAKHKQHNLNCPYRDLFVNAYTPLCAKLPILKCTFIYFPWWTSAA
jgi:hypothetical protein